ncbi:MAG: acireductone synthase [Vulcanimicrobiaceae bacterium]
MRARAVLTDIEGTTGSIAFVKDVLFPYADAHLDSFVEQHAEEPRVATALDDAANDAGIDPSDRAGVLAELHAWIAEDAKVTALKTLQGMIWAGGYSAGELKGHIYDDAVRGLRRWHDAGLHLYVYSSGSIAAQHLIFGHSIAGDLRPFFCGYFDTTTGGKREAQSYARIADEIGLEPSDILFLSDNVAELDAARAAGLQTVHVARPQDGTAAADTHPFVKSFDELTIDARP